MAKQIGILSACAHRLYLYRPELFDSLRGDGYVITVFGPEPQALGDKWLKKEGIRYIALPLTRKGVDPLAEYKAKALIVRTVRELGVGLLFSYGIRFAPLANNAARSAGIPCMNVINGAGSLFGAEGAAGKLKRLAILPYIRFSLRYSSRIVFQNLDDRRQFASLRLGREARYLNVNGSGVNADRYPAYPLPEARIFGYTGRLNPEKGIGELLCAFEKVLETCPDAKLRLAGEPDGIADTPAQARLDRLCASGQVEYLGEIDDVPGFLRSIRYFVFPSYYREGTPRVILEAMSCARPVITTDATGCRETVRDGYNGLLVKARDVESLTAAMLRFCGDDDMTAEMGRNSRIFAKEKFDVYAVNRVLTDEIKKLY
ncbi:MAG: glycosyltransferase family 4 protein [Clostridia bacterium]|nr:glycosyltransferase family 4 protein [Clostridia bacterium]